MSYTITIDAKRVKITDKNKEILKIVSDAFQKVMGPVMGVSTEKIDKDGGFIVAGVKIVERITDTNLLSKYETLPSLK